MIFLLPQRDLALSCVAFDIVCMNHGDLFHVIWFKFNLFGGLSGSGHFGFPVRRVAGYSRTVGWQ